MSAHATPPRHTDGFILVAVLWMLAALATLVSIYAVYVMGTANAFGVHQDRLQSEALVSAAVELTAHQLTSSGALSRPSHGGFDFRMRKANIKVTFRTEAARIDLNAAPKELLAGLFQMLGANSDKAANYAQRVVRWRTPSKDQVSAVVEQASDINDAPSGAPFSQVNELSLVPGLPSSLTDRVLPFVTVYSGKPQVNVLEAAPEVIGSLPGMNQDRLRDFLAQRRVQSDGQALLKLLGPAQKYGTIESSNASRIRIGIAYDNGRRANSEVIILPFDQGNEPYATLSWRDNLEPPENDGLGMASR